jgi:hypothetical protein
MVQRCNVLHHFCVEHGLPGLTEAQRRTLSEQRLAGYRQAAQGFLMNERTTTTASAGASGLMQVGLNHIHEYIAQGYKWLQHRITRVRNNIHFDN